MSQRTDQIIAGKYRLIRRLARGGMGSVYKARHLDLEIDVALKFLRAESEVDEQSLARFKREGRAAAQLRSPHVVQIFDFGVDDETPYIAMELLEGEDLSKLLEREGSLPLAMALELIEEAGEGLKTAHAAGVVHRDIKPANIFLARTAGRQVVKLLDFGIAKETAAPSGETTTGMVFGSPAYMSPEQARGGPLDVRGDIWSLGAVLYRMVLGQLPFSGANASDIVVKLCTEEPPSASALLGRDEPELDQLFSTVLAKDRNKRFGSVEEFLLSCRRLRESRGEGDSSQVASERPSRPLGRVEETAALEPHEEVDDERAASDPAFVGAGVRAAEEPKRSRLSRRVGWGLLLLVLGLLLLASPRLFVRAPSPVQVRPSVEPPRQDAAPPQEASPSAPERALAATDPKGSEAGEVPGGGEPKPEATREGRKNPVAKKRKTSPSRRIQPPLPAAAPSSEPQADKPVTDPVFGLPVGAGP